MPIEVGKVYKCGKSYVKIVKYLEDFKERAMFSYVGVVVVDSDGRPKDPILGMFGSAGNPYSSNPKPLQDRLVTAASKETTKKLQRIEAIEKELQQLKEDIKNAN